MAEIALYIAGYVTTVLLYCIIARILSLGLHYTLLKATIEKQDFLVLGFVTLFKQLKLIECSSWTSVGICNEQQWTMLCYS